MKSNQDLIGKTITGVVAVTPPGEDVAQRGAQKSGFFAPAGHPSAGSECRLKTYPQKLWITL
jgi:hypothetical protein